MFHKLNTWIVYNTDTRIHTNTRTHAHTHPRHRNHVMWFSLMSSLSFYTLFSLLFIQSLCIFHSWFLPLSCVLCVHFSLWLPKKLPENNCLSCLVNLFGVWLIPFFYFYFMIIIYYMLMSSRWVYIRPTILFLLVCNIVHTHKKKESNSVVWPRFSLSSLQYLPCVVNI